MKVGPLTIWLRHLNKGDTKPMRCYQISGTISDDHQEWAVESQSHPNVYYRVAYHREGEEEYISCVCKAVRFQGYRCKHMGTVLAQIHAVEMRQLIREDAEHAVRQAWRG